MDTFFMNMCACTLGRAFGYEPTISRRIIDALGSAQAVFSLPEKERDELLGHSAKYAGALSDSQLERSERELRLLERKGVQFLSIDNPLYPEALRDCEDAPVFLYIRSESPLQSIFSERPAIGVVGTRDISPYGREWCQRMVCAMASSPHPPVVVSGLALGVDITAHKSALDGGLPTIAVLPCGIDEIYPRQHVAASERIIHTPGSALLTDYPPATAPVALTFLRRNRIIAGLSRSTILVESKARGGGMITARMAFGYGREVFALPGRIDDARSAGCNALIAEKIAEPITSLALLSEQIGLGRFNRRRVSVLEDEVRRFYNGKVPADLLDLLVRTAREIKLHRGITLDDLCLRTDCDYPRISVATGMLSSDGFISIDLLQQCCVEFKNA